MTSNSNSSPVPAWFSTLIGEGLAALYLLSLEGCPSSEQTARVCQLWAGLLWDKRRWIEDADKPCIRAAFASLCNASNRWPAPAKFLEHLPQRPPPKRDGGLMHPDAGRENEAEAFAGMRRQFKELGYEDRIPLHVRNSR